MLKENRTISSPLSVVWGMSGNNPLLSDEIARRTIRIRLDLQCEHPEERTGFRHPNLVRWAMQNRSELLWAFLLLVQHWIASGCPASAVRPLGSFENWSKVLGGILEPRAFSASSQTGSRRLPSPTMKLPPGRNSSRGSGPLTAAAK
ncbi:MAG: hypothetical protein ABSG46_00230 [Candidatus Binataceae bacterium]|jgi:hypothetical protein